MLEDLKNKQMSRSALEAIMVSNSDKHRMVALTGGANSGKTTVLDELRKRGFAGVDEQASKIIAEHGLEVRDDIDSFVREIWRRQFLDEAPHRRSQQIAVTDRGIYDQVSYYEIDNLPMPSDLKDALAKIERQGPLYRIAFVFETLPNWQNNGIRDAEQIEFSKRFAGVAERVYGEHGARTVVVPVLPVEDRVSLVLKEIATILRTRQ